MTTMQVQELPVEQVTPAADNVRGEVGDVEELAASIASAGIVQPLVVVGEGPWRVVAGHRRLAAAKLAGLQTVPCVVRDLDDRARLEVMLVENLQRHDLTPLEEARGYRRLVDDHGLSQRDAAAKVGVSQPHVSKRLKLLTLPDKVLADVDAGSITVDDALQLTKLVGKGGAKAMARARKAVNNWTPLTQAVTAELDRWNTAQRVAKHTKALEADGVAVVAHDDLGNRVSSAKDRGDHPPVNLGTLRFAGRLPDGHEQLPCHAVTVSPWKLKADHDDPTEPVCTDPLSHEPTGDGNGRRYVEDEAAEAEREARADALAAAQQTRRQLVGALVGQLDAGQLKVSQILPHLLLQLLPDTVGGDDVKLVHEILGLDPPAESTRFYLDDAELMAYATGGSKELMRAALAMVLVGYDHGPRTYNLQQPAGRQHLRFLQQHGYEPTPYELDAIAAGEAE